MKKALLIAAVAVALLVTGCMANPTQDPSESIDGSKAITDATVTSTDESAQLQLKIAQDVQQNNEQCTTTTSYNPATGTTTTTTTCTDHWHEATINTIIVEDGDGNTVATLDDRSYNGERISVNVPWESSEYYVYLQSANGKTVFSVDLDYDNGELAMVGAGYDDSY